MNATGWDPSPRAPTRRSSSAASPPRSTRRWARTTGATPSCVPSRADGASHAPRGGRLRVSTAFASSRRTTYTSGTCSSASRSISDAGGWRHRLLGTDLTHRHGQRPAGGHPGHHGGRQAVARLPPRSSHAAPPSFSASSTSSRHWASPRATSQTFAEQAAAATSSPVRCVARRNCRTCRPTTSSSDTTARPGPASSPTRHVSTRCCCEMPRVLAAFDSRWGDARTNLTTYLQLLPATWTAATTRPTGCSTVPPPSRGSTTGTATSSHSASASSTARRTRLDPPAFDPTSATPSAAPRADHVDRRHPA